VEGEGVGERERRFVSSGTWRFVVGLVVFSVLKDCIAFTFNKSRGLLDT
jgi:hypothetical protein